MKISTKGRYALRFLVDLAEHQGDGYVTLKEIAERQEISKKYLEQIIPILHKSDLLQASRGFQGGYRLTRPPKDYTVGEILRLTEGSLSPVSCVDHADCSRCDSCVTYPVWKGLAQAVNGYLDSITLEDLLSHGVDSL
ncbi:MAG: RrF2 family transcriptional regulator [Christensenellaceae bacterium]